jgi:hypothetical protein
LSAVHVGRVDQKEADLIQNELVPQFLGLWVKLNKDRVPAHTGQRGLALALLQSSNYLEETHNWHSDPVLQEMMEEVGVIVLKFLKSGTHFALISAGLERVICQLLGTVYDPKLTPTEGSK